MELPDGVNERSAGIGHYSGEVTDLWVPSNRLGLFAVLFVVVLDFLYTYCNGFAIKLRTSQYALSVLLAGEEVVV